MREEPTAPCDDDVAHVPSRHWRKVCVYSSPLKKVLREGEAPTEPRSTSDVLHAFGSAGALPGFALPTFCEPPYLVGKAASPAPFQRTVRRGARLGEGVWATVVAALVMIITAGPIGPLLDKGCSV